MRNLKTALTFGLVVALAASAWGGSVWYDSLPSPLPATLPGLNFEATQTYEFGDAVQLAEGYSGVNHFEITVGLTNSATYAQYGAGSYQNVSMTSAGFTYPLTLTLYNVAAADPALGSAFATETISAFVPWLPAGYPADSILSTVDFSFSGVTLPNEFIYGLSFNTQDYGAAPTGEAGPYNSLAFALSPEVTVGQQALPGTVFWNTSDYADYNGDFQYVPFPNGILFEETTGGWDGAIPAVEIGVPEPISMIFFGTGLVAVGGYIARRRTQKN